MPDSMINSVSGKRRKESVELLGEATVSTLERVLVDSVRVVEEVGFACTNREIRSLLESTGLAAYDETTGHVHVLADLVLRAIEQAPKSDAFWVPMGSFGVGGTAPYLHDDETGELVTATTSDIERLASLVETNEAISFSGRGVMLHRRNREAIELLASQTSKTLYLGVHSPEEVAFLDELHHTRGKVLAIWDVIRSPLELVDDMVPGFLDTVRRGIPFILASMPMPAVSAPYSMTGLLTLCMAEFLIGLTVVNVVNSKTLVVCGAYPTVTSIERNYNLDLGSTSHNVANMLMSHLARLLDLPACQSGCTTNEEAPTDRAVADARRGYAIFKRYGCHMIRHAFGFTKDLTSLSFTKLERTVEAFDDTSADEAPDLAPLEYDEEAFDVISRNSSQANYLQDDHTLRNVGRAFISD